MSLQNKTNQKFISALLIILIVTPVSLFSIPKKVSAANEESASACAAVIGTALASRLIKKTITSAVSGSAAVPTIDKTTNEQTTKAAENTDSVNKFKYKECINSAIKAMLKLAAQRLLAKMTESTVSWINSGFHGSPLFIENPQSFFKDIAKSELRNLVNIIGYDPIGQPFGKSVALNIINSYKSTFEQNAQYSLSRVTRDPALLESFRNDFSVGGWDGFLLTTQFPQNNEIGYNIMVGQQQAKMLSGTIDSKADTVKQLLQQGQGFLSPQTCVTNPYYDNLTNTFMKTPSKDPGVGIFVSGRPPELLDCKSAPTSSKKDCEAYNAKVSAEYKASEAKNKADALKTNANYCPNKPDGTSGLVNTTPGSVVANQIMTATSSTFRQGELGAALGNSLSAIFDALLNKLMSSGLNALSGKLTGAGNKNNSDDLSYNGQTSGTDSSGTNNIGVNWGGPDEVIVLSTFKRDVKNAITNGNKELNLIDSSNTISKVAVNSLIQPLGITQVREKISLKAQELDMCLPGPNLGWEDRVDTNSEINTDGEAFKTWVLNKMKIELPGSNNYLGAINSIKTINAQKNELDNRINILTETLIKLDYINTELANMNTEPDPGSSGESTLIRLKQRYDGLFADLPDDSSVIDVQNKLADAKDKLTSLGVLLTKCTAERTVKGWGNPGGVNSVLNAPGIIAQTEKSVFCSAYTGTSLGASCDVVFNADVAEYTK